MGPGRGLLLLWTVGLAGCGAGQGDLTGTVTCEGRPVRSGTVQVLPTDRVPRSALIADGRYTVRQVPAGPVKLAVNSPDPRGQRVAARTPAARQKAEAAAAARADGWFAIPAKYASFDESGLTFEVRRGENQYDLQLAP